MWLEVANDAITGNVLNEQLAILVHVLCFRSVRVDRLDHVGAFSGNTSATDASTCSSNLDDGAISGSWRLAGCSCVRLAGATSPSPSLSLGQSES
jgi:hypothetical protein